ncbi:MAG: helix-turn-helix domain-containing protein [Ruminococcus sp.]|nr:helix-turn-helix domain-containing protein [Ruminococcus sp.]
MYNSQTLVENIKALAKSKNILVKEMLVDCDLNVNALNQMSDKKGISSFSLAKIADYLGVSVDYLLGRTETPEIDPANKLQAEFFKIFQKLPFEEQVALMNIAIQKAG